LFAEIEGVAGVARLDVITSANVNDPIPRNSDRAIFDGWSVHRDHCTRANNHR
jgi:hypothetical protein